MRYLTYTIHLPDGTHVVSVPCQDYIALRKSAMSLLASLPLEPADATRLKETISNHIADLREADTAFAKQRIFEAKEKARAAVSKTGHLKKPGKLLASTWAYQKEWRAKRKAEKTQAEKEAMQQAEAIRLKDKRERAAKYERDKRAAKKQAKLDQVKCQ